MAKKIGYEPSIIHRWELGVYSMSNDAIKEVNKFFGTNIFREGVEKIAGLTTINPPNTIWSA